MQDGFHHHAHISPELPRLVILFHNIDPHWEKKLEHATQKFWKRKKKKKKKKGVGIGEEKEEMKGIKSRRERLNFRVITLNSGQSSKY